MSESAESTQQSLVKQALIKIRDLQKQLDEQTNTTNEPIAIIGVGCRFPGGVYDLASLWQLLHDEKCAVTHVPAERWSLSDFYDEEKGKPGKMYTRYGSFLDNVAAFDPAFFGITPREARLMDPQQRLLLELSWEAMEHAFILPSRLKNSSTGVFIGAMTQDYLQFLDATEASDFFATTGNANSVCAGRIAYTFGFNGPTMTIDTACSSSLVAVHLACQSLRNHECEFAFAGGVNLQLSPLTTIAECSGQMLSTVGLCRTFDDAADGFVRGDGAGVVILKRLSEAVADNHPILGVILGSAVNHDGASGGLTVPNGHAQEEVIRKALRNANVSPSAVSYVEAHGTGTRLGDPIELKALQAVYGRHHEHQTPLWVGSIKTNLGHTEAAAGIAGLLKLLASIAHHKIPASLHLQKPNAQIPWQDIAITVPTRLTDWLIDNKISAVSSFGLSGTNAHLVVQQPPVLEEIPYNRETAGYLLPVSAQSETSLLANIQAYRQRLLQLPQEEYHRFCATAALTREHFLYRQCFHATSPEELVQQFEQAILAIEAKDSRLAFMFCDVAFDNAFDAALYATQKHYKQHVDHCQTLLKNYQDIDESRAATFCFQYALAHVWLALGVTPDAVWGEGVGAITAACIAEKITLDEAVAWVVTGNEMGCDFVEGGSIDVIDAATLRDAENALLPLDILTCLAIGLMPSVRCADDLQWIASDSVDALLHGMSQLYRWGCHINWQAYMGYEKFTPISLPAYAFQRQTYWVDAQTPVKVNELAAIKPLHQPCQMVSRGKNIPQVVQQVIALLMEITEHDKVPLNQPLQEWGMNSLMSVDLQKELSSVFAVKLPATLIFDYPTVQHIATYIESLIDHPMADVISDVCSTEPVALATTDIAIIGMACRFPGDAQNLSDFWQVLDKGIDCVTNGLSMRWSSHSLYHHNPDMVGTSYSFHAGLLKNVDHFDAGFFDISPREARMMDPQQRLTLEVVWHALEHAGYAGNTLPAQTTGIFMGVAPNEYARLCQADAMQDNNDAGFMATGNSVNAIPGRVAYSLGLEGPCLAIDTACSSSLVAIHSACQHLRMGECDMALAGGVNLLFDPTVFVPLAKAGMLSPSGHCHTFSDKADGFVRAEGCGVLVLKRLSDAIRDKDMIQAVIKGSAVNQDGRSSSLTAPSGLAQQKVIRTALQRAQLNPSDIQWVEAHGTGTPLGDPIEVRALALVYDGDDKPREPLYISSVKTNLGHPEAAAGVASVIKIALSMQHRCIPAHLHLEQLNPHIEVDLSRIVFPKKNTHWPACSTTRYAAASSFGFTGTNAHIVLGEAPVTPAIAESNYFQVLTLSAKSETALVKLVESYQPWIKNCSPQSFANLCYSSNVTRKHFEYRAAFAARDMADLQRQLEEWVHRSKPAAKKGDLVFLFSGHATQYIQMGKGYYDRYAAFKKQFEICSEQFAAYLDKPLLSVLWGEHTSLFASALYSQAAIFSIQVALVHLWESLGITPDRVVGHGIGEYAAAYTAGIFDLPTAIRLIAMQSRRIDSLSQPGGMVTIFASSDVIQPYLQSANQVTIAALNGPEQIIISGCKHQLNQLMLAFDDDNIRYRLMNTAHAYHSSLIDPILEGFKDDAETAVYHQPHTPILPSVAIQNDIGMASSSYWVSQLRNTICFDATLAELLTHNIGCILEIGSTNALCHLVNIQCNTSFTPCVASMSRQTGDDEQACLAIATLYQAGFDIHWMPQNISKISLPLYPFESSVYWPIAQPEQDSRWKNWFYQISWQEQQLNDAVLPLNYSIQALRSQVLAKTDSSVNLVRYYDGILELESLSRDYIINALFHLLGENTLSTTKTAEQLGIVPHYHALFEQLINMLSAIDKQHTSSSLRPVDLVGTRLLQSYPEIKAELKLLSRCGAVLAEVLTGKIEALELLFMEGDLRLVEDIYHTSPGQNALNQQVADAISSLLKDNPQPATLRILEIGAGTGGTSAYVLKQLPETNVHYVYTDISPTLLDAARSKFGHHSFIEFKLFDIEKDWHEQGFTEHSFDVVIAANVIHATRDVAAGLHVIKQLIVPGGCVLLVEAMHHFTWLALTFGLTEGWWRFKDKALRQHCPLLTCQQWMQLLNKTGFSEVEVFSEVKSPLQAVLIAKADGVQTNISSPAWLIFVDEGGYAQKVSAELQKQNRTVYNVHKGNEFKRIDDQQFMIRADKVVDYQQLRHALELTNQTFEILHFWSFDSAVPTSLNQFELENIAQFGFGSVFLMTQVFASLVGCKLWCITQQAQTVTPDCELPGFAQAGIVGAGKSILNEYPSFFGRVVDIDPMTEPTTLLSEINSLSMEEHVVYRHGKRYIPRLLPTVLQHDAPKKIHANATYLITGGLGGIGFQTAEWLVKQGARHIILCGRQTAKPSIRQKITALKNEGITLITLQIDIAVQSEVETIFECIASQSLPPLKGIFHAAGVGGHGLIKDIQDSQLDATLRPKILGSWWLHELTESIPLDFFVVYSSMVSIWGSKAQARYIVANQWMDSFIHYRRSKGLCGLTMNWGPWQGEGMLIEQGERLASQSGIAALQPIEAMHALELALNSSATQVLFADMDWPVFLEAYQLRAKRQLFSSITQQPIKTQQRAATPNVAIRQQLEQLPFDERFSVLLRWIQHEVVQIMGLSKDDAFDPEQGLFSLGMESLMTIQLKNRLNQGLEIDISSTDIFNYSSVMQLARYLADKVFAWPAMTEPTADEVEALIEQELKMLAELAGEAS